MRTAEVLAVAKNIMKLLLSIPTQAVTLIHGDCVEQMKRLADNSIDAIVTDPPYELGFMGKHWDNSGIAYQPSTWKEALRVLKPGGHLLAFGGTRTYHRMAVAIEDAGFEIRDSLHWIYGTGFPKSLNVGDGRGTALKPAHEPIVMARKMVVGTVTQNVERHGTGALNIDACRIAATGERLGGGGEKRASLAGKEGWGRPWMEDPEHAAKFAAKVSANVDKASQLGRWPANITLSHTEDCENGVCAEDCPIAELDRQSGERPSGKNNGDAVVGEYSKGTVKSMRRGLLTSRDDIGGASRFFYITKAGKKERNAGCDVNNHPTVKPVALMRYLIRLVTPPNGVVLDPFLGSGTSGVAAIKENVRFIGIEQSEEYLTIARARTEFALDVQK